MQYSDELILKVKELYPESKEMHALAENGSMMLGRWLDDSSSGELPVDWILKQTSLVQILSKAQNIRDKRNLYMLWVKEYDEFMKR